MSTNGSPLGSSPAVKRRRLRLGPLLMGMVAGSAVAVAIGLVVIFLVFRDTTPRLTESALAEAKRRWNERGPADYDLLIEVSDNRASQIQLQVRGGEATAMTRDGITPRQPRTWQVWTVPGQFEMMQQELENAARPQQAYGTSDPEQVILLAEFDQQLGYPRVFQRMVMGRSMSIRWQVEEFEVVDVADAASIGR